MQEAGTQSQCKANNVPAPSTIPTPTPAPYNIRSVVTSSLPYHAATQPVHPDVSLRPVPNSNSELQSKAAINDYKNNAQLSQPQGSFSFPPQNTEMPTHDSTKAGPHTAQPAMNSPVLHEPATVTTSPISQAGHSTTSVSPTLPSSRTEPAINAASVGSAVSLSNRIDSIAKGTICNTSPTPCETRPVNAPPQSTGALHASMQGVSAEAAEADRRAQDIVRSILLGPLLELFELSLGLEY
jgi:hypothetical protein